MNYRCYIAYILVSELSFQEGSIYNSEMETTNYDQEDSDAEHKAHIMVQENQRNFFEQQQLQPSPSLPTPHYSSQIQCMQEEILHLRAQIALLQSELACRESHGKVTEDDEEEEDQNCTDCKNEDNENDKSNYTSDDLCETADIFDVVHQLQPPPPPSAAQDQLNEFSRLSIEKCQRKTSHNHNYKSSFEMPVPKIAERVRLKRTMEENQNFITGPELTSKDVRCRFVAIK